MRNLIICIIILCISSLSVYSQKPDEIESFTDLLQPQMHTKKYNNAFRNNRNELQDAYALFFVFYKKYISPQDIARCVFYPSCSEYAMQAITKHGFIIGVFMATDRLMRCNPLSAKKYPMYKNSTLLYDPVK